MLCNVIVAYRGVRNIKYDIIYYGMQVFSENHVNGTKYQNSRDILIFNGVLKILGSMPVRIRFSRK